MQLEFYIGRPKSHFGTGKNSHILKESSPLHKTSRPDLDNYIKLVFDALNKVYYLDDSQITNIIATKQYSDHPRTIVRIIANSDLDNYIDLVIDAMGDIPDGIVVECWDG